MADDQLRQQLYERLKKEILDQAATWEETFDAGPGEVVSVSDAASVAARVLTPTGEQLRAELAAALEARVKAGTVPPDPFGGTVGAANLFGATFHDLADIALALVGDRVKQLEAEVARLRAGEVDEPPAPHTAPTAGQMLRRLNDASPEERLKLIERMLYANDRAATCFKTDHEGQLEAARAERERAAREIGRLRAMSTSSAKDALIRHLIVKAAGGRVEIPERLLVDTQTGAEELVSSQDPVSGALVYEIREAGRG